MPLGYAADGVALPGAGERLPPCFQRLRSRRRLLAQSRPPQPGSHQPDSHAAKGIKRLGSHVGPVKTPLCGLVQRGVVERPGHGRSQSQHPQSSGQPEGGDGLLPKKRRPVKPPPRQADRAEHQGHHQRRDPGKTVEQRPHKPQPQKERRQLKSPGLPPFQPVRNEQQRPAAHSGDKMPHSHHLVGDELPHHMQDVPPRRQQGRGQQNGPGRKDHIGRNGVRKH